MDDDPTTPWPRFVSFPFLRRVASPRSFLSSLSDPKLKLILSLNRWASEETPSIEGDPARARIQLKHVLPPVPSTGELDIEDVKKSRYFFK